MKTLQDIKNDIAKEEGLESWAELIQTFHRAEHENFYDKAAMMYANEKLQFAADNIDWDNCYDGGTHCGRERHEKSIEYLKDTF